MWLFSFLACFSGADVFIVVGTVVEVRPARVAGEPGQVVLDHEPVAGLMPAMVMPFEVADVRLLEGLEPGTKVLARYAVSEGGSRLVNVRITGQGAPPVPLSVDVVPIRVGEVLPATDVTAHDGATVRLGTGSSGPLALGFIYTRCPIPEFCPALMGRLLALDAALGAAGDQTRIVLVTLDPDHDTVEVLAGYAHDHAEGLPRFRFTRAASDDALADLAMRAGLSVLRDGEAIAHSLRLLVLDGDGKLIERYDDARFPLDRVVSQLRTGAPPGDPNQSGTLTTD